MNTLMETPIKQRQSSAVANIITQKKNGGRGAFEFEDSRPEAAAQQSLQRMMLNHYGESKSDLAGDVSKNDAVQRVVTKGSAITGTSEARSDVTINDNDSVVIASNVGPLWGHTRLLMEHKDTDDHLKNYMIELTGSSTSGASKSTTRSPSDTSSSTSSLGSAQSPSATSGSRGDKINIIIRDDYNSIAHNLESGTNSNRRVNHNLAADAIARARVLQGQQNNYRFQLLVNEGSFAKHKMNCALFGEQVLKVIDNTVSGANVAGLITPSALVANW